MTFELKTARGAYTLMLARETQTLSDATVLTLSLERRDGIEKLAFQCRVDTALAAPTNPEELLIKLAHWIERDFEMTRENALKSIRSEHKLLEIVFDGSHRGPF